MNKQMIVGAGILLFGVLIGVLIVGSPMYSWRGGMMHSQNYYQESIRDGAGPGMMGSYGNGMGMMGGTMFVTSERQFIEHMIPHHEEAIATAKEVLERGGTSQGMIDLANDIITSQTAEVELMKQSYEEWFGESYQDTDEYVPMMRDLTPYSGVDLDRVFLHDMTMHHMGAIMMSRSVQPYIEHDVMQTLTSNIIINQSREIQTMRQLYSELE